MLKFSLSSIVSAQELPISDHWRTLHPQSVRSAGHISASTNVYATAGMVQAVSMIINSTFNVSSPLTTNLVSNATMAPVNINTGTATVTSAVASSTFVVDGYDGSNSAHLYFRVNTTNGDIMVATDATNWVTITITP